MSEKVTIRPVTADSAADLEAFSLAHGRFRRCSCMSWRMPSTEFRTSTKDERAARLAALAQAGTSPRLGANAT